MLRYCNVFNAPFLVVLRILNWWEWFLLIVHKLWFADTFSDFKRHASVFRVHVISWNEKLYHGHCFLSTMWGITNIILFKNWNIHRICHSKLCRINTNRLPLTRTSCLSFLISFFMNFLLKKIALCLKCYPPPETIVSC